MVLLSYKDKEEFGSRMVTHQRSCCATKSSIFWVCMCHYAPKKHRKGSGLSCDFWEDSRRISLSYAFDSHISIVFLVINPQLLAGKPDKVRW